jgi:D-xylose transport system permease protein
VPLALVILGRCPARAPARCTRLSALPYAIGGNEEAATVSGVPVRKTVIGAYALMGFVVAITGFMQTAYSGASTTTVGALMELDAVAACVIGGTSLRGGRGTVAGVLFGALIMASLINGMTLMAVSPEVKYIARGRARRRLADLRPVALAGRCLIQHCDRLDWRRSETAKP